MRSHFLDKVLDELESTTPSAPVINYLANFKITRALQQGNCFISLLFPNLERIEQATSYFIRLKDPERKAATPSG